MNFTSIYQQIEIKFWVTAVKVMGDRQALLSAFAVLLCCLSLLSVGVLAAWRDYQKSANLGLADPGPAASSVDMLAPVDVATGQRNILVILVDRLKTEHPRLEGLWMLIELSPASQITFLPLYPTPMSAETAEGDLLVNRFYLEPNGAPGSAFLDALREKDLWWHNYLVLDEPALIGLVRFLVGVDRGGASENQPLSSFSLGAKDPRASLAKQAAFAQEICYRAPVVLQNDDLKRKLRDLFADYIYSDLVTDHYGTEWPLFDGYSSLLSCEFPTLQKQNQTYPAR